MSIDLGTPPASLLSQQSRRDSIVSAAERKSGKAQPKAKMTITPPPVVDTAAKSNSGYALLPLFIDYKPFKFLVEVYEFNADDSFVTIIHPKTVTFQRSAGDEDYRFKLTFSGREYLVEHVGITFELNFLNMSGTIFLRKTDDKKCETGSGQNTVDAERTQVDQDRQG